MKHFRFCGKDGEQIRRECSPDGQYLCNYYQEKSLRDAARQGRDSARRLSAAGAGLEEKAARADNVRELVNADRTLERTLAGVLSSELASVREARC